MGIPPGELLNPCLILIHEDIVGQRFDFAIAPKFNAAIVLFRGRRKNLEDDSGIQKDVLAFVR